MKRNIKRMVSMLPGYNNLRLCRDKMKFDLLRYKNQFSYSARKFDASNLGENPLVSIIMVNHNGVEQLKRLMKSFSANRFYKNFEIIFVDNASDDISVNYMHSWEQQYSVTVIKNVHNENKSVANNIGAKFAKGDYLVFLDISTVVTAGWLDSLLTAMQCAEKPGAIASKLMCSKLSKTEESRKDSYKVQQMGIAFREIVKKKQYCIEPYELKKTTLSFEHDSMNIERVCVTSTVMMIAKDVFESVGGFDENYETQYADVDICLQLYKAGYHNYYCVESLVYINKSDPDDKKDIDNHPQDVELFKGKWQQYLYKQILMDKLEKNNLFTINKLTFGIIKPEDNDRNRENRISGMVRMIEQAGYAIQYVEKKEQKWDVGINLDVLISLDRGLDIYTVYSKKNDLIRIETSDIPDNMNAMTAMIRSHCNIVLNEKEIDICGAMPDNDTTKYWGDYHYALALQREFQRRGYKANLLTREHWYDKSTAKYVLVLRGLRTYYPSVEDGRKSIMWNISHPAEVSLEEYNLYDYVFFASKTMKDKLENHILPKSGVLLQCTDPSVMCYTPEKQRDYELLFVGNSRHVYRTILKDLLPTTHKLTVYGRHWEEFPVKDYVESDYIDNEKVGQAYHDAKILLNDHWEDMREYGIISNRVFDALAVEAFVISDDVSELREVLDDTVVTYSDREDLNHKINYYLENETERREKAVRGREIVLEKHTFLNRVDEIISIMITL